MRACEPAAFLESTQEIQTAQKQVESLAARKEEIQILIGRAGDAKYAGYVPQKWVDGAQVVLAGCDKFIQDVQPTCEGTQPAPEESRQGYQTLLKDLVLQASRIRRLLTEARRPSVPIRRSGDTACPSGQRYLGFAWGATWQTAPVFRCVARRRSPPHPLRQADDALGQEMQEPAAEP